MDHHLSITPPHPDIRRAFFDDVERIRNYEHEPPTSLEAMIDGDHWLAALARDLVEPVGSVDALERLGDEPHPAEQVRFDAPLGLELLQRIEAADLRLDSEMATIVKRIIGQLVDHPDRPLERKAQVQRIAGAIAWLALKANQQLGRRSRWTAGDLWFAFGVSGAQDLGHAFQRVLFEANRTYVRPIDQLSYSKQLPLLGDARLLHSTYRRELIAQRNDLKQRIRADQRAAVRSHPIQTGHDQISFACRPTTVRWVQRSETDEGRATLMVGLNDLDDMTILSITVTDARRLVTALEHALNQPATQAA